MKLRITLTIALVVSVLLISMISSDSRTSAQNQNRVVADTGIVTLGQNQVLRVMVSPNGELGPINTYFRFRRVGYSQGTCSTDGVCKLATASVTASDSITLTTGEAASFDIPASFLGGVYVGVRGVVLSNRRDVQVNAMIIDSVTGEVVAFQKHWEVIQ